MGSKLVHATEECPHCHNMFSVARLAQHMNVCLRNPELLAALRVALEASPGVAKSGENITPLVTKRRCRTRQRCRITPEAGRQSWRWLASKCHPTPESMRR